MPWSLHSAASCGIQPDKPTPSAEATFGGSVIACCATVAVFLVEFDDARAVATRLQKDVEAVWCLETSLDLEPLAASE